MPFRLPKNDTVQNDIILCRRSVPESAPLQRSHVTAWIPGSARVASLLAPPWNDEVEKALANLEGLQQASACHRPRSLAL